MRFTDGINPKYIQSSVEKATVMFYHGSNRKMSALALGRVQAHAAHDALRDYDGAPGNLMYVDFVCVAERSQVRGKHMLEAIEAYAKAKGLRVVALRAISPFLVDGRTDTSASRRTRARCRRRRARSCRRTRWCWPP